MANKSNFSLGHFTFLEYIVPTHLNQRCNHPTAKLNQGAEAAFEIFDFRFEIADGTIWNLKILQSTINNLKLHVFVTFVPFVVN